MADPAGEFRVNTSTSSNQQDSSVAALTDGGFVVTWTSGSGIYGQRYAADGTAAGSEFNVASGFHSSATSLTDGGFVLTWTSGQDIYGQRYADDGTKVSSEFLVNTQTINAQANSSVVGLVNGGFVVTWLSVGQDGSGIGIYGQRYAADGTTAGSEFLINTTTAGDQVLSSVAPLADGGFVVTWNSNGQDGSGWGVYGQRYGADGAAVGSEFRLNDTTAGDQIAHSFFHAEATAVLTDGTLASTWSGQGTEEVFVRLFDTGTGPGAVEDAPFPLSVSVVLADTDGSETISLVTLAGLPAGFEIDDGSNSAISDGTTPIDVTGWALGALTVTPTADFNGEVTVTVNATSEETANADTATTTKMLTFEISLMVDFDVFVANFGGVNAANQVLTNDGSGAFVVAAASGGAYSSWSVALGDLDGDGDLDALVANDGAANQTLINDGSGTFAAAAAAGGSYRSRSVALGDLDGDGDLDAFVANNDTNQILTNDGSGTFAATAAPGGVSASWSVALGDLDGDGDLDAFIANTFYNQVLINQGGDQGGTAGAFLLGTVPDGGNYTSYAVALGDLDGDGDLDAFVANNGANQILTNDGTGVFAAAVIPGDSYRSYDVALGDLDGDGDLDAFVANRLFANQILTNDGFGNFVAAAAFSNGYDSFEVALGDLDGDGGISPINEFGLPNLGTDDLLPSMSVDTLIF